MGGRNGERNMGDQRIWYQKMGSQGSCFKGVTNNAPFQGYENGRKYGGKGCMEMERWCKGYGVEEEKACVCTKHV